MLDIHQIRELIPHRFPMLLIDRIEHIEAERAVGIKNVTANEPFFQGHFPDFPVMPGVLIIECMAQVGAVWLMSTVPDAASQLKDKLVLFAAIEQAKFRRPVFPGDQLRIEMELVKRKATVSKMKGRAIVDGKVVAEAVLMCNVADKSRIMRAREPSS
jgi:3-hydroxyacyl-[acyl-carrier-protein] dehydratase